MGRLAVVAALSILAGACIYDTRSLSGDIRSGDGGVGGASGEGGSGGLGGSGGVGGFAPASRATCETCTTDVDCAGDDHRCVQLHYRQEPYPDSNTGYCLRIANALPEGSVPAYDCERPYVTVLSDVPSLSSSELHSYCSIREDLTTCDAMRAHQDLLSCAQGGDLACPVGGFCERVRVVDYEDVCTYACGSDAECLGSSQPRCTSDPYCQ